MLNTTLSTFGQTIANMDNVRVSNIEVEPNYTQYNLVDKSSQEWLGWVREIGGGNATSMRAYCATGANGSRGLWVSLHPEVEVDAYGDEHRPLVVANQEEMKKEVMLFVARWSARFVPEEV